MMNEKSVAIIIPAYNEELTIEKVIKDFHSISPHAEIIIVDNCSSDRTQILAKQQLAGLPHCKGRIIYEARRGKAAAMRRAFKEVDADIYVMVDADCTYPAQDLPKLIEPVRQNEADIVIGNRHAQGRYNKENKRPFHSVGNRLVLYLINLLFNGNLKDILSGYRVMNRQFVKNYPILSKGFGIETEMSIHALDKGYRVLELPTEYKDRPEGSFSKLNTIKDGLMVLRLIFDIFIYFRPLTFFSILGTILFLLGSISGSVPIAEFYQTSKITHLPLAILAVGFILCSILSYFTGIILDGISRAQRFNYELSLLKKS